MDLPLDFLFFVEIKILLIKFMLVNVDFIIIIDI